MRRPKGRKGDMVILTGWGDGSTLEAYEVFDGVKVNTPGVRIYDGCMPFAVVSPCGKTWRHNYVLRPKPGAWYVLRPVDKVFALDPKRFIEECRRKESTDHLEGFEV